MDKKEYLQAIGVYPLISLKEARKRATESRSLIANGINPVEEARKEKAIDALNMAAGFSGGLAGCQGQRVVRVLHETG